MVSLCHRLISLCVHAFTQESNDAVEVRGSFQETVPRKTAENTVKHRDGGVGSGVANHCGGGEISVVVTTLPASGKLMVTNAYKRCQATF